MMDKESTLSKTIDLFHGMLHSSTNSQSTPVSDSGLVLEFASWECSRWESSLTNACAVEQVSYSF